MGEQWLPSASDQEAEASIRFDAAVTQWGLEARAAERAACAELVRAAGCLCRYLDALDRQWDESRVRFDKEGFDGRRAVVEHDPRCPEALAARIEARGKE